jgi:hypothetical protein
MPTHKTQLENELTVSPWALQMKTANNGTAEVECYQDADLSEPVFKATCDAAEALWQQRCQEYLAANGQKGSSVIGAGFTIWYLPPRARKPQHKMILHSPLGLQGSLVWEETKDEIGQVFQTAGIDVHYEWGSMD